MTHSPSLFTPEDISAMRTLARLSQTELAEALGYDQRTISAWECGTKAMTPHTYIPFLDVIMRRYALLGYVNEQKSYLFHVTVVERWCLSLPPAITVL